MNEYSFSVAHRGYHLFTTNWEDNERTVEDTKSALQERFKFSDGYTLVRMQRSKVHYRDDISVA